MATRRSEWLASIKPILDRDEAKKDAAALAKELGDILEVKVGASPENLDELAKEFNTQLKTMGKQPIVFSEKTLRGIVSQFTKEIAQGISTGVSKVDFGAQLEELNKKREKILKAQNRANQAMKARTRMERLENFNINTAELLPMDGDMAKEAQQIVDTLYDSASKIDKAAEKYGKSSSHYTSAVMDAQEAYNKYLRMQKTLGKMPPSQLATIPKDVRALYDKLGPDRDKYEAGGGMNIPFEETFEAEKILDSFEEISDAFEEIVDNAGKFDKMLKQIDAKIEEITRKARESGGVDEGILSGAEDGLKTLSEIEAAYKRLKVDKGTKLRQQNESHIKSALDFDPAKNNVGIKTFAKDYYDAAASGDWVEEYHALLRYVKLYESYLASTNKTHQNKVTAKNNPFTPLYEQLKPMAENARNMLQNILNMGENLPLVGMGGAGSGDGKSSSMSEDADSAQKIRKEAEARIRAEREALELARQKREEEERLVKAAAEKAASEKKTKTLILEQKEVIAEMLRITGESGLFFNSKTGDVSDTVEGGAHSVETLLGAWRQASTQYDTRMHKHNYDVAAPSFSGKDNDFATWIKGFDHIKRQMILANKEILSFDFSSLSKETLQNIANLYSQAARKIDAEFDGYIKNRQVGEMFGTIDNMNEQLQMRLREALTSIMEKYPGVMTSYRVPQDIIDASKISTDAGRATGSYKDGVEPIERMESLQNEIKQKNSEIAEKNAALQAADNEKKTLQNDLDVANRQNAELRERASNDGDAIFTAEQRANEAEEKAAMYDRAMTSMQEEMADLRGKLANAKTGGGEGSSASLEELKNVLSAIVYNVKIAYDDSDKTANKISLDDSTLEATLTKVFANILKPEMSQGTTEQPQEHWALESTLQNVKVVLDNIQTNTTKIGTVKPSNVDTIAGTALDSRLAEIKSVLESIDSKIAKGGVIATRGAVKQANAQPVESEAKVQAARSNMMKSLINDYKTLGKLSAKFASDNNLETKAMLENLKEEIARKRKSLKLTMDESASLREKYSMAFDAEKRLLDAKKAQEEIDRQNRQDDRDEKADWKKKVKDAQRETGINAADSVYRATNNTVIRAIGTEGISADIEAKAKELAEQNKVLNSLRNSINEKGANASEKDRDNLSKQIVKVKELKTEVDGYLKIHEKYSGDNVTDLGDASNFGALGTNEYWNNITAAIKSASDGRVAIKGMNADTGELTGTTKIAANTFAQWSATVDPLTGRLSMLRTGIKKTETIIEQITRKTKEIFTYFSGSSIIFKAFNEIKKGVQYVRDIDLALTELKKVTDETEETYRKFLDTASKTAAKVGSTIKDVVSSTADWARLGYSMEEAAKFAETTQILMNVSEFTDVSQATDTLISSVQAFGYTAETSMEVVDLLNTIGNNYAISTADLAQSLTKSSASLVAAGGDLAEAAALTATANKIVQDADSVGTALKTTSLRLRGTEVSVLEEEGLDSEGAVSSKSKLQSKVKALSGVDILTATGEYKSTYEILRDIADVWESMNDMDQAALLELISGKRNSSVIAAILQNPKELKAAFEDANNASGSALKENEKYLDSIQGKIDQFNNAVQSMWSNFLDADVVKFIVELGTELIKVVDAVGLLNSAILVFAGSKFIPWLLTAITGMGTFGESLKYIGMMMTSVNGTGAALIPTIVAQTQALWAGSAGANVFALSLKTVGIAFKALMSTPLGWFLAIGAAIALTVHLFDVFTTTTAELKEELEDLQLELRNIKSDLESVNSELETTNDRMAELLAKDKLSFVEEEELKMLQKRNEELQRELDLLELKEKQTKKDTANKFVETMNSDVNTSDGWNNEYKKDGDKIRKIGWYDWVFDFSETFAPTFSEASENDYIEQQVSRYQEVQNEIRKKEEEILAENGTDEKSKAKRDKLEKEKNKLDDELVNIEGYINGKTTEWNELSADLDYGINDETDAWLDYINNMQDKWAITSGGSNAKSNALNRIFNKDENSGISKSIDQYVEALQKGDTSAKTSIENIIKNNKELVEDLETSGLSIDDAVAHFTQFASDASYETIDGKIKEVDEAYVRLSNLLSASVTKDFVGPLTKEQQEFANLFNENGEVLSDAIAKYFGEEGGGVSEKTRAEIERLVKQIRDGKITVEDALKSFELFGVQSVIDIQVTEVKTNFKDVFSDLEDVDGLVDTFEELGDAINSTLGALDAFNQAQADVADKGFVSIQTALQLMEYTDDYGSVLEVVDGKLQLAANAEQNLIQARIDAIKVSAQTAVADAQAAYDKAELAVQSYRSAMVEEISAHTVATAWEKIVATAAGIKNALDNIWSGESLGDLYSSGYNTYLENATGYKTSYDDAGLQALEDALADANKKLTEAKGNAEIANAMTADGLEDLYKSSDKKTKEEVADDAFQKEMDYWENRIAANQAKYEQLQNEIDLLEAKGQKADASFYEDQIELENERKWLLEQQKEAAKAHLATLTEGSEEWWETANVLNDIEGELDDVTASILDLQDAIAEIDAYKFEEFNTRLDNLANKLETIRNLIAPDGEEDWFDDEGDWTEAGVAVLGAHIQELEFDKEGLKKAQDELDKYSFSYSGNEAYYEALGIHSEQEYYDKVEELTDQQYQYLESISDTEQSIVDMYESSIDAVEEYTETLIDGYNDYIDSVKEALDAERDLYDFKKNVQKQAKDIAEIERRITSLSGSTNAADIAERRKLEAQLYESRESLNDTYYDHAKDAQNEALDKEAEAYETAMTNMIDGLRTSLEEATSNMDEFLMGVTSMVMYNADTILSKYEETNLPLTKELTNPWEEAKKATSSYSGNALDLMNQWTKEGGFFAQFNAIGTANLKSPWSAGTTAANSFKSSVSSAMTDVVSSISSNVKTASGELSKLYQQIIETEAKAASVTITDNSGGSGGGGGGGGGSTSSQAVKTLQMILEQVYNKQVPVNGIWDTQTSNALKAVQKTIGVSQTGEYDYNTERALESNIKNRATQSRKNGYSADADWYLKYYNMVPAHFHAKGTTGTTRDEWVVTDESWIGEEITLAAGKNGQLQYLKKGSAVMPADISANLVEWGKINPSMFNTGLSPNVNMITNAINKPELNISFESLIKAENITEETLPAVKKLVTQELNRFTKELNYALKGKGAR